MVLLNTINTVIPEMSDQEIVENLNMLQQLFMGMREQWEETTVYETTIDLFGEIISPESRCYQRNVYQDDDDLVITLTLSKSSLICVLTVLFHYNGYLKYALPQLKTWHHDLEREMAERRSQERVNQGDIPSRRSASLSPEIECV